jgi:hypothetical protein
MPNHRSETFEATQQPLSDEDWYRELTEGGVSALLAQAQVRHRRDLPELLKDHPGKWAAYFGEERIALGDTKRQLIEKCVERGLKDDEFLVLAIAKQSDPLIDAAMWMHI